MKAGDLVNHIDRKDVGIVIEAPKPHGKNRAIWVYWSDGETRQHQTDYYLTLWR